MFTAQRRVARAKRFCRSNGLFSLAVGSPGQQLLRRWRGALGGKGLANSLSTTTSIEKRRCARAEAKMPITLIVETVGGTFAYNPCTFDLSELGAGIETSLSLKVGQSVKIIAHDRKPDPVRCRVAWTGERQDGTQATGLEFLPASTRYW
jgi:PilZ domain